MMEADKLGSFNNDVTQVSRKAPEEKSGPQPLQQPVVTALLLIGGVELNPGPHENIESAPQLEQSLRDRLFYEMEQLKLVEQRLVEEEQRHSLVHQQQITEIRNLEHNLKEERKVTTYQLQELQAAQQQLEDLQQRFDESQRTVRDLQLLIEEMETSYHQSSAELPLLKFTAIEHDGHNTPTRQQLLRSAETCKSGSHPGSCESRKLIENNVRLLTPIPKCETSTANKVNMLTYKKRKGADMSGELFEVKLAALLFLRGVNHTEEFLLASSFEAASSYDDLMFNFRLLGQEVWVCSLIQLKHKQLSTNFTISLSNLLSIKGKDRGNFSLCKYSNSFHEVKENYNSQDKGDLSHCGQFNDIAFILYSNAPVDQELRKRVREQPIDTREMLLSTSSEGSVIAFDKVVDEDIFTYLKAVADFKKLLEDSINDARLANGEISEIYRVKIQEFSFPSLNTDFTMKVRSLKNKLNISEVGKLVKELNKVNEVQNSDQYEQFFDRFRLYENQAHEAELEVLIKNEIKEACFTNDAEVVGLIYKEIRDAILEWWKFDSNSNSFLTIEAPFWKNINLSRINSFSKLKFQELRNLTVKISASAVEKLKPLIPRRGILNVVNAYQSYLSCSKLYHALVSLEDATFIFVSLETLYNQQEEIVSTWRSKWCNTLVVDCNSALERDVHQLCLLLDSTLKQEDNKRLLLISPTVTGNALAEMLKCNIPSFDEFIDTCQWSDLDQLSQDQLLTRSVSFQGHKVPLNSLVKNDDQLAKILNGNELSQLLGEELLIGPVLHKSIDYYIPRRLCRGNEEPIDADKLINIGDRMVIVVAEPGMGKSTLLTHLSNTVKYTNPHKWVLRINLNECISSLEELRRQTVNVMKAVEFLTKFANVTNSNLERNCFKHSLLVTGGIVLFIDGVDEICPDYKNEVSQLLQCFLFTKIEKLWVTSRPVMKEALEDKLGILSFTLEPFTIVDQANFLKHYWNAKHPLIDDRTLGLFIKKMLKLVKRTISEDNLVTFIPQLTLMFAECYEKYLIEFSSCDSRPIANLKHINKIHLYEHFIQAKFIHYSRDKKKQDPNNATVCNDDEDLRLSFLKNHMLASLHSLLSPNDLATLNVRSDKMDTFLEKIKNGREKTGLIDKVTDGKPHFIHRTFSEHLAGKWFSENINSCRKFLEERLFEPEFEVIRENFDYFLAGDKDLHIAILDQKYKLVDRLLSLGPNLGILDGGGRTQLHLAVSLKVRAHTADKVLIVKKLLELGSSLDAVDDVLLWRPLQYADHINDWGVAKLLIQKGGKEDDLAKAQRMLPTQVFPAFVAFLKDENSNPVDLIHTAARYGTLEVVQFLFAYGVDLNNCVDKDGVSVMHRAAEGGHLPVIHYLVKQGASCTVRDNKMNLPLHYAAIQASVEVITYLCEKTVCVSLENIDITTPLHIAVENGNVQAMEYMMAQGWSVTAQNKYGWTPLLYASSRGEVDVMRYLVERGASVNDCNNEHWSSLHFMTQQNNEDGMKYLIGKGAFINTCNKDGSTALLFAAEKSSFTVIKYLVEQGSDVNASNMEGWTPLLHVSKRLDEEAMRYLISHGASVHSCNRDGWTPLLYAASSARLPLIKYLVELGADVNCCNEQGFTPLLFALHFYHEEAVTYLLDQNASVHVCHKNGMTPLLHACVMHDIDLIMRLLEKGASIDCSSGGLSPLHFVVALEDDFHIGKILIEHGASVNASSDMLQTPLHMACRKNNGIAIRYLTEKGSSVCALDSKGFTPLVELCYREGNWDSIVFLIENGSPLNVRGEYGRTLLHMILQRNDLDLDKVKYCVKNGSSVNVTDDRGNTPLLHAAYSWSISNCNPFDAASIITYLVECEAEINLTNNDGWTALLYAGEKGNEELMECLFENGSELNTYNKESWNSAQKYAFLICAAFRGDTQLCEEVINDVGQEFNTNEDVKRKMLSGPDPLLFAASQGNLDIIKLLCERGIYCHVHSAICGAIRNNQLIVLEYFLDNAISVRCSCFEEETPLHVAVEVNDINAVSLLLKHKADVNEIGPEENGCTPLHVAACNGFSDIVHCLLQYGAESLHDCNGDTPLSYAATGGEIACAKLLVENGADVEARNKEGCTPLHGASSNGHVDVLKLLMANRADVNGRDDSGNTALHLAAEEGRMSTIECLVENGADIDAVDEDECSPLHNAATWGNLEVIEYLLEQGALLGSDCDKRTPLHCAAKSGKLDAVKILLRRGSLVNAEDCTKCTPLADASQYGILEVVEYLVENSADPQIQDDDGNTPLHFAVMGCKLDIVKYLKGCVTGCLAIKNNNGKTALDIAVEQGYKSIADLLVN